MYKHVNNRGIFSSHLIHTHIVEFALCGAYWERNVSKPCDGSIIVIVFIHLCCALEPNCDCHIIIISSSRKTDVVGSAVSDTK